MVQAPFSSVTALAEWRDKRPDLTIIDARAERMFLRGHIPGAVYLDARNINADGQGARQLVDPGDLANLLQGLGVGPGPVVVYGARGGSDSAHVWWTLVAMGMVEVWILDGGIEAWIAAGLPTAAGGQVPSPAATLIGLSPDPGSWIDLAEIQWLSLQAYGIDRAQVFAGPFQVLANADLAMEVPLAGAPVRASSVCFGAPVAE